MTPTEILRGKNGRAIRQYLKRLGKCSPEFPQEESRTGLLDVYDKAMIDTANNPPLSVQLPAWELATSTHVFKTTAKTAVCASNTRIAKDACLRLAFQPLSHKSHRRQMKKENKIKSIPLYLPVSEHKINYKEYKDNIYFLGNEQKIRPELW